MSANRSDSRLQTIEEKVHAGERISFDEGLYLDSAGRHCRAGPVGQRRARAEKRRLCVLQHQHPPEPHQRLRLPLHVLRVSRRLESRKGLHVHRRHGSRAVLEAKAAGATEIHVVGGLHHLKDFDWYLNVVR